MKHKSRKQLKHSVHTKCTQTRTETSKWEDSWNSLSWNEQPESLRTCPLRVLWWATRECSSSSENGGEKAQNAIFWIRLDGKLHFARRLWRFSRRFSFYRPWIYFLLKIFPNFLKFLQILPKICRIFVQISFNARLFNYFDKFCRFFQFFCGFVDVLCKFRQIWSNFVIYFQNLPSICINFLIFFRILPNLFQISLNFCRILSNFPKISKFC